MEQIRIEGDRVVVRVNADTVCPHELPSALVRLGTFCQTTGIRKVLYIRDGFWADGR